MVSEFTLRPVPMIEVCAHPAAVEVKRLIDKELRAAWGSKGARWLTSAKATQAAWPALYLSCQADLTATSIAVKARIGLAHFVPVVRERLPEWVVNFAARGNDGVLQLMWGLDVGRGDAAQSVMGRVPKRRIYESEGRRFWDERDGGISLLSLGAWTWNPKTHGWQMCNE